jgi:hypothetical protein
MGTVYDSQRVNMVKPGGLNTSNWDTCREESGVKRWDTLGHINKTEIARQAHNLTLPESFQHPLSQKQERGKALKGGL